MLVDKLQPLIVFIISCSGLLCLRLFTKVGDETYEYIKKMVFIAFALYVIKLIIGWN